MVYRGIDVTETSEVAAKLGIQFFFLLSPLQLTAFLNIRPLNDLNMFRLHIVHTGSPERPSGDIYLHRIAVANLVGRNDLL